MVVGYMLWPTTRCDDDHGGDGRVRKWWDQGGYELQYGAFVNGRTWGAGT